MRNDAEVKSMEMDVPKSRRGLTRYKDNPFIPAAAIATKTGVKRITNKTKDRMMIVSEHGEIMAPAGFHEVVEVDKSQFIKLYQNGVVALADLTKAGAKVFEIIFRAYQEKPGTDRLNIHFQGIDQDISPISRATFDRGMKELLEKQFIAESLVPGLYFINIDYMFNGNRLAFIKEYRVKGAFPKPSDVRYREELEARGQQRLDAPMETDDAS